MPTHQPPIVFTPGDPCGIGPETIARAWRAQPDLVRGCFVAGDVGVMRRAVALLGDAAHPMYPIGSNGASQAILDADALALALKREADVEKALLAYDAERVPATSQVVLQNRQKGPDFIMDLMEERFPAGFEEGQIPHAELAEVMAKYKQIAGFDVETLNAKA